MDSFHEDVYILDFRQTFKMLKLTDIEIDQTEKSRLDEAEEPKLSNSDVYLELQCLKS